MRAPHGERVAREQRESRQERNQVSRLLAAHERERDQGKDQPSGEEMDAFLFSDVFQPNPEPRQDKPGKQNQR
ncbi:hypothetical protein D3C83_167910 [compost metagenome]